MTGQRKMLPCRAALLLLAICSAVAAPVSSGAGGDEDLVAATEALAASDDECSAAEGSDCALSALQLRSAKLQQGAGAPAPAPLAPDLMEKETYVPIQHYLQDCSSHCAPGFCDWCGQGNACCRHNWQGDPAECRQVYAWPTFYWHTCVNTAAEQPSTPSNPPGMAPPSDDCSDEAASCPGWAERGECEANPRYMETKCRLSCKVCSPGGAGPDLPAAPVHDRLKTPPEKALGYGGIAWPDMTFPGTEEIHVLAIGDWGGMDGEVVCKPRPKKPYYRIIQYKGGDTAGPHTMARSRQGCKTPNLVECFNTHGMLGGDYKAPCYSTCGVKWGVDDKAQLLVAEQFKKKAAEVNPQYILNVGDNFYWGGIETDCGEPMTQISEVAKHQFDSIFESIYNGPGLDGKPWLSVLGNHDWGGRYFNAGWDQQIAYTWASNRWILPAPYWSQHVEYPDQDFSVDIFMIDTNYLDAKDPSKDPEHNICGALHNPEDANCGAQGGPESVASCKKWFHDYFQRQKQWLEEKLAASTADWQIVNTHFPCGHESRWYAKLHQELGLDLLVTGHRHDQELWSNSRQLGGLTCFVTGGGGGITSEGSAWTSETQYGFFDLALSKETIKVQLINWQGKYLKHSTVYPKAKKEEALEAKPAEADEAEEAKPAEADEAVEVKPEEPKEAEEAKPEDAEEAKPEEAEGAAA